MNVLLFCCRAWCCTIDTFSTTSEIVLNVLSSFLLVTNLATLCLNVRGNVQLLNDVWNGIVPGTEVVVVDSLGRPNILFLNLALADCLATAFTIAGEFICSKLCLFII